MKKLHLALVWHMHQPYYKDDLTQTYLLPWVRLHCAKDYNKMAGLLDAYPRLRQTFNLVPSLLAQIDEYARGEARDLFLNLAREPAAELSAEQRQFLLRWIRETPSALRVQASPRYYELASKREPAESWSLQEIRDCQVWSNLAWCDPAWVEREPRLNALKIKDGNFSEADKDVLFECQLEIVRSVLPKYRDLAARGQIELTTSPYYHPILPLVCDVETARAASPGIQLPDRGFAHREDAEQQLRMGMATFERLLGRPAKGMWPSEMAVSEPVAALMAEAGLDWFISDEDVLARSLETDLSRDGEGRLQSPELLYEPYLLERDGRAVAAVFRDKVLSNLMGFEYYTMSARDAAQDFMARLRRIREQQGDRDFLVTVALDGENAWEFYPRDGHDFLNALYSELENADDIVSTTVGDFLSEHPERRPLRRLHSGSWIGASYDTWIGDPEHTVAWELLAETRDWLEDYGRQHPTQQEELAAAWREIMITEGSDWYWWFSHRHDSGMDVIWDNQFRLHLRNVYKLVDARPPSRLFRPIIEKEGLVSGRPPAGKISPSGPDDRAWAEAGSYEVSTGFGALHRPGGLAERVLYGYDDTSLHLRIDGARSSSELGETGVSHWLFLSGPELSADEAAQDSVDLPISRLTPGDIGFEPGFAVELRHGTEGSEARVLRVSGWKIHGGPRFLTRISPEHRLAFSIPFAILQKEAGQPLEMALTVVRGSTELDRIPPSGSIGIQVPGRAPLVEGSGTPLKVLVVAAEVSPFAKTGGLADVAGSLPKELRRLGHDVRLVMPRYGQIDLELYGLKPLNTLQVPLGSRSLSCSILEGRLADVPVYFVDCPELFDRDALYGFGDDDARFIFFNRAVLEMLRPLGWIPDVLHLHDWHTALIPNLLDRLYADDPGLASIATVLTIHNLGFQGQFSSGSLHLAGLENWGLIKVGVPHIDDNVNLLGRGIHYADAVSTVSERYAQEIQLPEYGEGMDALLRKHAHKLYGIVNGIDYQIFDPAHDPLLPDRYTAEDLGGKVRDKVALRAVLGLEPGPAPLIALISRLYDQKGLDLIEQALPALLRLGVQLAVLGTGERRYEDLFRHHADQNPGRVSASIGFDTHLAQLLYAGSDMLLMASRFEPCGLGQLIAMRYGTIPIVRATGGLVDTVQDFDPASRQGYGFVFEDYDPWALFAAVVRAVETHRDATVWSGLIRTAMRQDVSWRHSATLYVQLYRTAVVGHRDRRGVFPAG